MSDWKSGVDSLWGVREKERKIYFCGLLELERIRFGWKAQVLIELIRKESTNE